MGKTGDGRYLENWYEGERSNGSFRWSRAFSRMILPVEKNTAYTIQLDVTVPAKAAGPDAGLYLDGKRLAPLAADGPLSALLDVNAYVQNKGGFLASYSQDINGETLTGAQIVVKVAQNYSVNPRVLLALLEYRAQWITNANPDPSTSYDPIGYVDDFHQGLYRQLTWSADMLNQGFYRWKEGKVQDWTLGDGSQIVAQPGINPGTAAIQHFFAMLDTQAAWPLDTGPNGFFATYSSMFGYPFDMAIEPLVPAGLTQPTLSLPFEPGQVWQYTGGPHAGWDQGSAWAALDFAPPSEILGCVSNDEWVVASGDGPIIRAGNGAVIQDLDVAGPGGIVADGKEGTGWIILYMHIESRDRVQPGTYLHAGEQRQHRRNRQEPASGKTERGKAHRQPP